MRKRRVTNKNSRFHWARPVQSHTFRVSSIYLVMSQFNDNGNPAAFTSDIPPRMQFYNIIFSLEFDDCTQLDLTCKSLRASIFCSQQLTFNRILCCLASISFVAFDFSSKFVSASSCSSFFASIAAAASSLLLL